VHLKLIEAGKLDQDPYFKGFNRTPNGTMGQLR
jgi:hypothetical protein